MRFHTFALKSVCVGAALLLLAACESTPEQSADSGGSGAAQQTTTTTPTTTTTQPAGPRPGSQEDLVLNVGDRVFYGYDQYDLQPQARATVERWAEWLRQYPQITVSIEGHCDERGTREYNLALGERRASSARNYLIALGISADRVATISYGKERPVCTSSDEACWAQNRRGTMLVN
ncbi:MAG: peptidoglycan-associated lipoprotein Pal [Alphaproteobacteria bacterium]